MSIPNDCVEENLTDMEAWRVIPKKWFKKEPETYYVATPYLKLVREKREWSLRDLATRANISVNYYHDFERGKVRAKEEFVRKIMKAFDKAGRAGV